MSLEKFSFNWAKKSQILNCSLNWGWGVGEEKRKLKNLKSIRIGKTGFVTCSSFLFLPSPNPLMDGASTSHATPMDVLSWRRSPPCPHLWRRKHTNIGEGQNVNFKTSNQCWHCWHRSLGKVQKHPEYPNIFPVFLLLTWGKLCQKLSYSSTGFHKKLKEHNMCPDNNG